MKDKLKVLVTGANGLLGYSTISVLQTQHDVFALVRTAPKTVLKNVTYQIVDFSTPWQESILPKSVDVVIHLAQSARFREFPKSVMDVFSVNIESTARLLDYSQRAGVTQFIYASSGGIYGNSPVAFDEESAIIQHHDLGYYLGSKLCSEVLANSYSSLMNITVLRPFFMYGARQRRSMLIPRLVDNIRAGRPITLQGEEGLRINPVHVSDVVKTLEKMLQCPSSQVLNVAGPDILSIREISEIVAMAVGKTPSYQCVPGMARDLIGNNKLMRSILGKALTPFRQGILEMI